MKFIFIICLYLGLCMSVVYCRGIFNLLKANCFISKQNKHNNKNKLFSEVIDLRGGQISNSENQTSPATAPSTLNVVVMVMIGSPYLDKVKKLKIPSNAILKDIKQL